MEPPRQFTIGQLVIIFIGSLLLLIAAVTVPLYFF